MYTSGTRLGWLFCVADVFFQLLYKTPLLFFLFSFLFFPKNLLYLQLAFNFFNPLLDVSECGMSRLYSQL